VGLHVDLKLTIAPAHGGDNGIGAGVAPELLLYFTVGAVGTGGGGILRLIILQLLVLMAVGAQAAPTTVAGRKIEVPIPAEYCQFGKRFIDVELARVILSEIGNDNLVLAFFANCEELDAYRHGKMAALDNFGLVFAQARKGSNPEPIPGLSRPEFIKKNGGVIIPNLADVLEIGESQYKLAQARGNPSLQSQQPFRLQADQNGAYFAIFGQLSDGRGKQSKVLGVFGITLVKEMFLSIEIYRRFTESPPLEALLERQQAAMAKLVAANQ